MKSKLFGVWLTFAAMLVIFTAVFVYNSESGKNKDINLENVVALNEIDNLYSSGETELAAQKSKELKNILRSEEIKHDSGTCNIVMCGICLLFSAGVLVYIYINMIRPFEKLKGFAAEISNGNFDVPLDYERTNYFGEFTWAFDSMRREITKSRSCEREAIENNKTVIATLSHDIKTPIASVRAYAEGLEANLDSSAEKRRKYLSVIMRKCDEVSKLTDDLFLHSLSDLEKLRMQPVTFELCSFMGEVISELSAGHEDIHFEKPHFTAKVSADKNRVTQIAENLINNSRKYAKTDIYVSLTTDGEMVHIHFKDKGKGIPDEDMPFIFEKFYRGKNCGNEQGSGLGLYIVKYIVNSSGGDIMLKNTDDGFEAEVSLPTITDSTALQQ